VVPLLGLAIRTLRDGGFAQVEIGASAWNSVVPAALAASVLTVVGIVHRRAVARDRPGSRLLDALAVLGFVTPAAVLG